MFSQIWKENNNNPENETIKEECKRDSGEGKSEI